MTRTLKRHGIRILIAAASTLILWGTAGCDDGYYGGGGYVDPLDLSPYGYDYDMYDLFTEDIW